ncbi:hypothetical protein M1L60_40190 [Actinoplanes sp. TRM 88003]|uniref:Uncharacterized protein n=1 Tax=Paractinoplanes aksuensis TaxID=2939490 RepID=A0ABT1E0Z0_9ACTN|nr:hypothetical protein [Actinoplanes aksuensis]MCO8276819.1 hypothetical protein [Actinoplanes aksuensis]
MGAVAAGSLVAVAALAPVITAAAGHDSYSFNIDRFDPTSGAPVGSFGGISGEHWLGVEPGMGRDVLTRLVRSLQFSLGVALAAALVQVLIGLGVAVAVRRGRVRGLLGPALLAGALLVPLNLIVEVRMAYVGRGLRTPPDPSWGEMLSDASVWYAGDPAFLLIVGGLLVVTVLAFLLLAEGLRRRFFTRIRPSQ